MQETDGSVNVSLAQQSVRAITDDNFKQIMVTGLPTFLTEEEMPVSAMCP